MEQFDGNWLFIKTPDHYVDTDIIVFNNNDIMHFEVERINEITLIKKVNENWREKLSEIEYEFINPNRIRLYRKGKTIKVIGEDQTIVEDCLFSEEYEKLNPTETRLTEHEIQNLTFELNWNNEKFKVAFNKVLDKPYLQEINKRLNRKGSRIVLEKLYDTYFISLYDDIYHKRILPIKYVDKRRITLYGFPGEPYEVSCQINT